jgi:hypothetical protein
MNNVFTHIVACNHSRVIHTGTSAVAARAFAQRNPLSLAKRPAP